MTGVLWLRRDVRLADHPALASASGEGELCVLYVFDPAIYERVSGRRRALLVAGLRRLDARLADIGGRLRVEHGDPVDVVPRVMAELGADRAHVTGEVTAFGVKRDAAVAERVALVEHGGLYTHPPGSILTGSGGAYRAFTPFFRKWSERDVRPVAVPAVEPLSDPGIGLPSLPEPGLEVGEEGAMQRLQALLQDVERYPDGRDRIDLDATSGLSVDLKHGWIGPRQVVAAVGATTPARRAFVRQVAWRDFYGHLAAESPETFDQEIDPRYRNLPWRDHPDEIAAWKHGLTGYPLIDAAMRRLVAEGLMHNRARMAVASFLVKDLLVDWRVGERFFRHHLIDADTVQNIGNWQWVAGTGTDAAPYFRIFNPVTQSRRHDPEGRFIRTWLPELAGLPDEMLHAPWEAGPLELAAHGVVLGESYPEPIVDHAMARRRALDAYEAARGSR